MYLRMPLFTFLSGVVYAYRPFREGVANFMQKKARRLLLPMLTVGTAFALLQAITPGTNSSISNWLLLHIQPVAHFWFIESLFLVFVLIVVLEKLNAFSSSGRWAAVFIGSAALYVSPLYSQYFSFSGFLYLLPYFLLGMGVQRYDAFKKINSGLIAVAMCATLAVLIFIYHQWVPSFGKRALPSLLLGVLACLCLLSIGFKSTLLAKIGVFSYSIYLFHVFFTAVPRIVFGKFGIDLDVVFFTSLVAGIMGPIVLELVLARFNLTRVLLLGKAPHRKPKVSDKPALLPLMPLRQANAR
ncbi:acyltransferase [Halioxenophilus aromaticivorans]|uniref:Acyltransferase n=2 Tax=Halioxenophilus aromaticivorans TaxID=1306992 RepID=A0AAV3UA79_9ALTE